MTALCLCLTTTNYDLHEQLRYGGSPFDQKGNRNCLGRSCGNCQGVISLGGISSIKTPPELVTVHNVWTIYGLNPDGSEADQPIAQISRLQDWGNKERWHYELFCFEWIQETKVYVNHVHCWTDLKLEQRGEYPMLFAQLIVQIVLPGTNPKLCGQDYLDEDDFWSDEWGDIPPYAHRHPYEEEEEEET